MFNVLRDYDYLPQMVKDQEYLFGIATHCIAMTSTLWLTYKLKDSPSLKLLPQAIRMKLRLGNDHSVRLINGTQHSMVAGPALKYGSSDNQRQSDGVKSGGMQ
ncbi:hypothetical protein COOONC_24498 [Cooperia oncophora]